MRITVGGKTWNLRYVSRMNNRGECDYDPKIIRIRRGQQEHEELDTLIHELLHAANPWHDEEVVDQTAGEVARVLFELGYRKAAGV